MGLEPSGDRKRVEHFYAQIHYDCTVKSTGALLHLGPFGVVVREPMRISSGVFHGSGNDAFYTYIVHGRFKTRSLATGTMAVTFNYPSYNCDGFTINWTAANGYKPPKPAPSPPPKKKPCQNPPGNNNGVKKMSKSGIDAVKRNEATNGIPVLKYYNDPLGYCTTGWGHLVNGKKACADTQLDKPISLDQAISDLNSDVADVEATINESVTVSLNQNQFDALADFIFNLGPTNFKNSSLLKKLNCMEFGDIAKELLRWVHGHDKDGNDISVPGLVKRRGDEAALFTKSSSPAAEAVDYAQRRSEWSTVALFALGVAALPATADSRTDGGARLNVPASARAGQIVKIRGSGWTAPGHGCSPVVKLRAYVTRISPYATQTIPSVSVTRNGMFVRRWSAPHVTDKLSWTIRAQQTCAGRTTVRYATLTIA
jgi:lysozyme